MFSFSRDGTKIIVRIEHLYPLHQWCHTPTINCHSETEAILLMGKMRDDLDSHIKKIKAAAYKAGRKRGPRFTEFCGSMNPDNVGYAVG